MVRTFCAFLLLTVLPTFARAQWVSDSVTNTPVCTASNIQEFPRACSDGNNGAIIVWEDVRSGYHIYAQHVDRNGYPTWTNNGVLICKNAFQQRYPVVASDNHGGAYIVWQDSRNSGSSGIDLFCQHISAGGQLLLDTSGRVVGGGPGDQVNATIVSDGIGSAYVAWQSMQAGNQHIFLNRISPSGVLRDSVGQNVSANGGVQKNARICEDGAGGCYLAWENAGTDPTSIYAMRMDSTLHGVWQDVMGVFIGTNGVSGQANSANISLARDGNEIMLAWQTASAQGNGWDVYANRVRSSGSLVYGTYHSPVSVVSELAGDQYAPQVFSDDSLGSGSTSEYGMLVTFENYYSPFWNNRLGAVRILPDGSTRQPLSNFTTISLDSTGGYQALKVGTDRVLLVWDQMSNGDSSIFAQRIDRNRMMYFPPYGSISKAGEAICNRGTDAKQVALAPCTNGAIAAWTDYRNGTADIYAQLIFYDGSLPIELASFNATATKHGDVDLRWETANEHDCAGFELQRRTIADGADNNFATIASYAADPELRANGTTNVAHDYSYRDQNILPGIYEYRLIDIALDGSRNTHDPKLVNTANVTSDEWSIGANQPNPVSALTQLPITLAEDCYVGVALFDATGRELPSFKSFTSLAAGPHTLPLNCSALASGTYFVRLTASDAASGNIVWQAQRPIVVVK